MKNILFLFGVPLVFVAAALALNKDFLMDAANFSIMASNPKEVYNQIVQQTDSEESRDSAPQTQEGETELGEDYESVEIVNPFEDFDLKSFTSKEDLVVETDYPIVPTTYVNSENDNTYKIENCYIKNVTDLSKQDVLAQLLQEPAFGVEKNSDQPQILIMHTHATESYQNFPQLYYEPEYTCRDTDTSKNMVSVGKIMTDTLNSLGYNTIQDATLHDYPNYNGSYERSKATVEKYLAQYPSIKVVLDVHRDAIERTDGTRIKPVTTINGKDYAQVMIISGADNGYMNMPNYLMNLRFASHFQNSMETNFPSITRPILFDYRNYNQQLTTGSLLVEIGGHANTLEEAQNSGYAVACSLANLFDKWQ